MTEKELRKLSRLELVEMLIEQSTEVIRLNKELDEANKKLKERIIICEETGNIAEAALQIDHIFEKCQKAADLYLESVKKRVENEKEGTA